MDEAIELKPCPCCGPDVDLFVSSWEEGVEAVECPSCSFNALLEDWQKRCNEPISMGVDWANSKSRSVTGTFQSKLSTEEFTKFQEGLLNHSGNTSGLVASVAKEPPKTQTAEEMRESLLKEINKVAAPVTPVAENIPSTMWGFKDTPY